MNVFRRLDFWIGTRLFHPPIIWLCQRTGMTQWAIAAYAWMAATFTLVMRARFDSLGEIIFTVVVSLMAIGQTIFAGFVPDMPRRPSYWFRIMIWAFAGLDMLHLAWRHGAAGDTALQWSIAWDAFALIGEYAKTIDRIPPRRRRERRVAAKEAFS